MAYFGDLSDYAYAPGFVRPGTKAVGWLARGHAFPTMTVDEEVPDLLWLFCSISVVQTRGLHDCEFCPTHSVRCFERNGQRLSLGSAEIRVFSPEGAIYAAPTLIYHYVAVHHYKPPDEFLQALRTLWDIERTGLKLREGLMVPFYRPDFHSDSNGESIEDYLLFEGAVHRDTERGQWYTIIDQKTYHRESVLLTAPLGDKNA